LSCEIFPRQARPLRRALIGRFAAELFAHLQRDAAHLRDFVDQVDGRRMVLLWLASARLIDCLIHHARSAQACRLWRIEALDGLHQADIALGDQV
jgi:hypothetical protein